VDDPVKYDRPIHELLRECAQELREPFTAGDIIGWFTARYPDIATSAVRAHIQAMTGNVPNREENHPHLGSRPPVLRRTSRGIYVRWAGSAMGAGSPELARIVTAPAPPGEPVPAAVATEEWFWEGNVQAKLLTHLVGEGWDILRVADTRSREGGTDVVARRDGRLLHVEVKGWPSTSYRNPEKAHLKKPTLPATQARVWFNDAVVHALRLRDAHPDDEVAMCLPDQETYRALCRGINNSLQRCQVAVLLVRRDGACIRP
jgi:Holliday junction resolvase-like predicted endonuclease